MGRLKAGEKPTPHKQRLQIYRDKLIDEGGRRVIADLGPEGAQALAVLMAHDKKTMKDTLTEALVAHAQQQRLL